MTYTEEERQASRHGPVRRTARRALAWAAAGVAIGLALAAAVGRPALGQEGLLLKVTLLYSQGRREFTYQATVPSSEGYRFESDPMGAARRHLDEARKRLAEKQGYRASIHGPDHYKIIQVDRWFFTLTDPRSGRTIASGRPESGR